MADVGFTWLHRVAGIDVEVGAILTTHRST